MFLYVPYTYIRSRLKLIFGICVPYTKIEHSQTRRMFLRQSECVYLYCLYLCTSYIVMYLTFMLLYVRIEIGRLFLFIFFLNLCLFGVQQKHLFNKLHLSKLYTLFTVELHNLATRNCLSLATNVSAFDVAVRCERLL